MMMKFTDMEIMEITGFGLITNSILNVSCFRFYYLGGDTEKKWIFMSRLKRKIRDWKC